MGGNQVLMQKNHLKLNQKNLTTIMLILKILVQRRMKTRILIPTSQRRRMTKRVEKRKINFISVEIEVELLKSPKFVMYFNKFYINLFLVDIDLLYIMKATKTNIFIFLRKK